MSAEPELKDYFREAASWDADRAALTRRSARLAWFIAGLACAVSLMSAAAVVALVPLKTVQPYLVRVDSRTGIVDVVPELTGASADELTTRYLLAHYVTVCERYVSETVAQVDYYECGAFHTPKMNAAWGAKWARSNPQSPLVRYADGTRISVHVNTVTFLKTGTGRLAQVRYVTSQRVGLTGMETTTQWIATIEYTYLAPSKDLKQRQWNPWGFRVVEFRPELEAVSSADVRGVSP